MVSGKRKAAIAMRNRRLARREFLAAVSSLAGGIALESLAAAPAKPTRIDVHSHIWPPKYVSLARENKATITIANGWTPAKAIEDMDQAGTATALTSITAPGLWFGNKEVARKLARESNDYAAQLIRDHPRRFGMFAALPLPDIDGSLREIEYALDTLKADGICMFTVYQDKAGGIEDRFLGHAMFTPIYEELNRRKAVVYTHPKDADCCQNLVPEVPATLVEYGTHTTRSIASLIFTGTTTRFPDMRFITKATMMLIVFLLIAASINAETPRASKPEDVGISAERLKRIHSLLQSHIDAGDFSGSVAVVARNGKVAYIDAQGLMDVESKKPMIVTPGGGAPPGPITIPLRGP